MLLHVIQIYCIFILFTEIKKILILVIFRNIRKISIGKPTQYINFGKIVTFGRHSLRKIYEIFYLFL